MNIYQFLETHYPEQVKGKGNTAMLEFMADNWGIIVSKIREEERKHMLKILEEVSLRF